MPASFSSSAAWRTHLHKNRDDGYEYIARLPNLIGKLYQRVAPAALAFVSEKGKPRSVNCLRWEACIFNVLAVEY